MRPFLSLVLLAPSFALAKDTLDPTSVKKVAIIAFSGGAEIEQNETRTGVGMVDGVRALKQTGDALSDLSDGDMKAQSCARAQEVYTAVEAHLEAGAKWEITDLDALLALPAYTATREAAIGNDPTAKMAESWCSGWKPPGLLHSDRMLRVDQAGRDQIIEAAGVDAVIVVTVSIAGDDQGVAVAGVGTSRVKPQATVMVTAYVKGEKKLALREFAVGKKTEEAIKGDFGAQDPNEWKVILDAVGLGVDKLALKLAGG